jgi:ABC-type transporter Mla MlaB component
LNQQKYFKDLIMSLKTTQTPGTEELTIEGDFNLRNIAHAKAALLESNSRKNDEALNLKNVTALDLAGVQLAYAWRKSLQAQGRQATITLPEDEGIKDLIKKTGITNIL